MSKYSQAVVAKKPEFSYLETPAPLRDTYSDGNLAPYAPEVFPYAKEFLYTLLHRVNETYGAIVEDDKREQLCKELYHQLKHDFRFDFSDHLGGMRQRDKRGAETTVEENDYNMFHSCYKFVNQAARAKSFGERFNLSLMSGRVNSDNQTGPEICDPFVFGPALYLYSKTYLKAVALTLPGFDTPNKIATLKPHEKEMKKDMFARKALAAKELKGKWHHLINEVFMPQGMTFKDLSLDTVKSLSVLHKEMLTDLSTEVENHYQNDVKMLKRIMTVLNKQQKYNAEKGTSPAELGALQLASIHAMQGNQVLKDSSVIQVSIEAEKPIFKFMADILEDDTSLTAQIFDNPKTRAVFEEEMKKIHTTKDGQSYTNLLDRLVPMVSDKTPDYCKMLGDEYTADMDRKQIAQALRNGDALPKVSFMLSVVLMETGAKIEGGSSQIVYARKIKEGLSKVFDVAAQEPEFDTENLSARRQIFEKYHYRTAQAQIWGVKEDGNVLGYRNLVDGTVHVTDELLDAVASVRSADALDAASVHRFYTFSAHKEMTATEREEQKARVKENLLQFRDKSDYTQLLAKNSKIYNKLHDIIKNDENAKHNQTVLMQQMAKDKVIGL